MSSVGRHREPGDTLAERVCRRVACVLVFFAATFVPFWLHIVNDDDDTTSIGRLVEQLRPEGFGIAVFYICTLLFGAVALGAIALAFRPRATRWLSGLSFLLLCVLWLLLVYHVGSVMAAHFPTMDLSGRYQRGLDMGALYVIVFGAALFPPVAVVLSGKLFERVRSDLTGPARSRPLTAHEVLILSGVLCAMLGGACFALGLLPSTMRALGLDWWLEGPVGLLALVGSIAFGGLVALGGFFAAMELATWLRSLLPERFSPSVPKPSPSGWYLRLMTLLVPAVGVFWALSAFVMGLALHPAPDWLAHVVSAAWFFGQIAAIPMVLARLGQLQARWPHAADVPAGDSDAS